VIDTSIELLIDQLVDRVADAVVLRLGARLDIQPKQDEMVDEPTMADIAKVSAQSLQRRRKAGEIPFVQCGRRVLYRPADVIAALASKKNGGDA
jgi:hypothetical protein